MIAELRGTVSSIQKGSLILDVAGVGYKVYMTEGSLLTLAEGAPAKLAIYTVVRETALELFGFESRAAQNLFELLLEVPGIGPRSALGILSLADVRTLEGAIASGNAAYLTRVSGIGKKSAEKIVITLQDKIQKQDGMDGASEEGDALEALHALGYSPKEAREALQNVPRDVTDAGARIREALKILGRT